MSTANGPMYADSTTTGTVDGLNMKDVKNAPENISDEELKRTEKQVQYQSYLETRLTSAQEVRDRSWPEFSNKTYALFYQDNEKISNTYLAPKKTDDYTRVSAGTIEAKLNVLLSHIDNLNLTPEIRAFDKDNNLLRDLGTAFTDILEVLAEHDGGGDMGDAEKRLLRQKELLKQGTVFVQDKWCSKYKSEKVLRKKYDGTFNFDAWDTVWKASYTGPDRTLLYGLNVYLGDITQFSMDDQPYVFTVEDMPFENAKAMFGKFENWEYVKPGMSGNTIGTLLTNTIGARTIYDGKFRMTTLLDTQVEVIKYQDPIKNEFQIIINGVMMLPIGFPLSAVSPGGKINIAKQVLYPINPQFAYGKSFVSSGDVYELSKVLDEMLNLFILKTKKSITPAYINTGGKVISKRSLLPGNISMGITPGALQPINSNETQGVTNGEFQIYQEILNRIEQSTVSPIFQGQFGKSNTTATEVLEVQRQARLALGIIISACTLMEVKLSYLRLPIVIENYFVPIDELTGEGGSRKKQYRSVSRETEIPGAGKGIRKIIPIAGDMPSEKMIRNLEILDESASGYPSQRIYMNAQGIRKMDVTWKAVVVPKERDSSAYEKLMFREVLNDAITLYKMGSVPNLPGLEGEFSKIYSIDRNKIFGSIAEKMAPKLPAAPGATDVGGGSVLSAPTSGSPAPAPGMTPGSGA